MIWMGTCWPSCSARTRAPWATAPPPGPCHCWPRIYATSAAALCRNARYVGVCRSTAGAGSACAMSTVRASPTLRRKKQHSPALKAPAARRRALVHRLDLVAAVSAAALGLVARGGASGGADHRCQCQARAVWGDQRAHGPSRGAHAETSRRGRCTGLLHRVAAPLPQGRPDLAAAGSGPGPHGCQNDRVGGRAEDRAGLAAQAAAGVEWHGPVVEGVETADGG